MTGLDNILKQIKEESKLNADKIIAEANQKAIKIKTEAVVNDWFIVKATKEASAKSAVETKREISGIHHLHWNLLAVNLFIISSTVPIIGT